MAEIKFTPVAKPVDTVAANTRFIRLPTPVAPVKPMAPVMEKLPVAPQKSNVDQLAAALAGLNPKINALFGTIFEEQRQKDATDAELRFFQDGVDTWADAVAKDPTLADRSPYFRQVYEARAGRTRVQKRAGELLAKYHTSEIANSEDPTAINKWLADGFRDLIEGAAMPAERSAIAEEMQSVSAKFINGHREAARNNLVQKNRESFSAGLITGIDGKVALGPAAPYQTQDPESVNGFLKEDPKRAVKAALLNGIAGGESAGKYNIRYDGGAGSLFDHNGEHPKIFVPTKDGRKSSAAGRYQFTWSTWEEVWGKDTTVPMTAENQDKAALILAERQYKASTGGNLWDDLEKEGFSSRIQASLSGRWEALKGNRARNLATFNASLTRYGQQPKGPGAQDGNYIEIVEDVRKAEIEGKKQGFSRQDINALVLESISVTAIKHGREDLLAIAMEPRPDGTPGPGTTVEGRKHLEEVRTKIRSAKQQEQSRQWAVEKHDREVRKDQTRQAVMGGLIGIMKHNQENPNDLKPLKISPDLLATLNREHPELAEEAVKVQKNMDDWNKTEDPNRVAQFQAYVYSGHATPTDVYRAVADGTIRQPGTITNLYEQAGRNINRATINRPEIKFFVDEIGNIVGKKTALDVFAEPEKRAVALMAFSEGIREFEKANPNASPDDVQKFAKEKFLSIVQQYKPDFKLENLLPENQAKVREEETKQRDEAAGFVTPRAGVEWRKVSLYPTPQAVDEEKTRFDKADHVGNRMTKWVTELKLTPTEFAEFIAIQKKLAANRPKRK